MTTETTTLIQLARTTLVCPELFLRSGTLAGCRYEAKQVPTHENNLYIATILTTKALDSLYTTKTHNLNRYHKGDSYRFFCKVRTVTDTVLSPPIRWYAKILPYYQMSSSLHFFKLPAILLFLDAHQDVLFVCVLPSLQ